MRIGGLPVEACCRFVHGRLPKDARCGQGAFRVQAAPPKDSFDSPVDTRSSALPKHDSRLLFAPPPILCRCRNGAALQQAPVQACERRAGSRELFEPSSSTAQTFVLVSGPAIDDRLFFKKPVPARAPAGKGGEPLRCALASCRMPTYDMVFCAGDKHHDVAAKPYSVDEHDAVRFAACGRHRPEFPEPRSEAPEGSRRHPHLGLALFDRSRSRSVLRSFAALSMLRVEVALQDMHCQRLEPDDVLP